MRKALSFIVAVAVLALGIISSCSKSSSTPDPCAGITIGVTGTTTNATTGQTNGSITTTATGGSGITYSLNGGASQSSGLFSNLAAGSYTVSAKSSEGCSGSASFVVGSNSPCPGVTITVSTATTSSTPCSSPNGAITVTATGSTGFTYSLNNGTFQSSNIFNNIAVGSYSIVAKDANGCSQSGSAVVAASPAGSKFAAVKQVMLSFCAISGCHIAPGAQNGLDFSMDCTIVSTRDRIKARAVDGTSGFMPPPPRSPLSAADKQKIIDWINAGGAYAN